MLEVTGLTISYSGSVVIKNLTFSLVKGEVLPILGPSGVGKTSLLKVLSWIHKEFDGNVFIDGLTPFEFRKSGKLSYMFQSPTLLPQLSVIKNLNLALELSEVDMSGRELQERLSKMGLKGFSGFLPNQLSQGMQSRVALLRSFITRPKLLLLDEPFASLDYGIKQNLYSDFQSLVSEFSPAALIVTHDIEEAIQLATNKLLLVLPEGVEVFDVNNGATTALIQKKLIDASGI